MEERGQGSSVKVCIKRNMEAGLLTVDECLLVLIADRNKFTTFSRAALLRLLIGESFVMEGIAETTILPLTLFTYSCYCKYQHSPHQ